MRTIDQVIEAASQCLGAAGIEEPRKESEFLLASLLDISRSRLILDRCKSLPPKKAKTFRSWLAKRRQRKPLAYISGEQPFRDICLKVNPSVLIPRPETELLVDQAFHLLDSQRSSCRVADVGTGSGNVAISLSRHPNVREVMAFDISREALRIARSNASRINHSAEIRWLCGDLLSPVRQGTGPFDMVIANLPYVRSGEMKRLEPELHWEPALALDGGPDGLELISRLVRQAAQCLRPKGYLLLEIGADQADGIRNLFRDERKWDRVELFRDLSDLPRIIQVQRREA